jgi:hypothetical protein
MIDRDKERWTELWGHVVNEEDPARLAEFVRQIIALLGSQRKEP